jgi:mannose-6-phosphate isomerase-like protein (cupin superfamily)
MPGLRELTTPTRRAGTDTPARQEADVVHVLRHADIAASSSGSVQFEGAGYGAGVSFFLVNSEPGEGPDLHRHPYAETWIVRAGRARFTVDGDSVEAGAGDIVVVGPGAAHLFRNVGPGRLEIVCIHAADRMVTEWLTPAPTGT